MKKTLGISEMLERDVPRHLDLGILAYAAIANRRRKVRKTAALFIGIAAMCCCAAGVSLMMLPEKETRQELSNAELLALNDFTSLEQASYAIGATVNAADFNSDNYI